MIVEEKIGWLIAEFDSEALVEDEFIDESALVIFDVLELRLQFGSLHCALSRIESQTQRHCKVQFKGQQRQVHSKLEEFVLWDQPRLFKGNEDDWGNENGQHEEYTTD